MKTPKLLTVDDRQGFSLASTAILSGLVALVLRFFILENSLPEEKAFAVLFLAVLLALYFVMLRTGRISAWRRVYFVMLALLFFPSFIAGVVESRGSMLYSAQDVFNNETAACFIVIPLNILTYIVNNTVISPARLFNHFASLYSILVIWLIGSVTIGRGWCSWVCFYGGWDDGCSRLSKKTLLKIRDSSGKIRYFNFAMLIFVALASLATFVPVYCKWLCPFRIITETADVGSVFGFLAFVVMVITFFGLAIILPILTRKRVQCMSFCPFGALQSLMDKISPYRVRINTDACIGCLACVAACPTLSLSESGIKGKSGKTLITCTKCGECISACPKGAIRYEFSWIKGRPVSGLLEKIESRLQGNGRVTRALRYGFVTTARQIFSAKALIVTSGFIIGSIVDKGFAVDTLMRIWNLFAHGTFL